MNKHDQDTGSKDHKTKADVTSVFNSMNIFQCCWTEGLAWIHYFLPGCTQVVRVGCFFLSGLVTRCTQGLCARPWDECLWPSFSLVSCWNSSPELVALQWAWGSSRSSCGWYYSGNSYSERALVLARIKLCGNLGPHSSMYVIIAFPSNRTCFINN